MWVTQLNISVTNLQYFRYVPAQEKENVMIEEFPLVVSDKVCHLVWKYFDSGVVEYSAEPLTRAYAESVVGVLNNSMQPKALHWFECVQQLLT